ncbi:hypothetical protein GDO81_008632 [Engystomops pustulosus]|uniref:Uncharacterized protein n=1 Tax=Engystomops pustulosus TaxID=76066 RepID=A0AAV7CGB7_ENGPU|nr:hypothetical protein GDO81_008632 [Engystomops pustulosus]
MISLSGSEVYRRSIAVVILLQALLIHTFIHNLIIGIPDQDFHQPSWTDQTEHSEISPLPQGRSTLTRVFLADN